MTDQIEIRLVLDGKLLMDLRNAMTIRAMSGNAYGIADEFLMRLVEKLTANEKEWIVKRKT